MFSGENLVPEPTLQDQKEADGRRGREAGRGEGPRQRGRPRAQPRPPGVPAHPPLLLLPQSTVEFGFHHTLEKQILPSALFDRVGEAP